MASISYQQQGRRASLIGAGGTVAERTQTDVIMQVLFFRTFAVGLPEDRSLRNLDEIRSRFKDSLTPMGNMIDVLRDSGGK